MGRLVEVMRSVDPQRELCDEVEPQVAALVARAVAAWPGVHVDAERFVRAIAERLPADLPGVAALEGLQTDDLYLACGCAVGDPGALAGFEAHYGPMITRAVATIGASAADCADLGQIIRERLLVSRGNGDPPRIARFLGRGSLAVWVRVVATREALRTLARVRRLECEARDDELADLTASDDDPEVGYLKRLYRDEFKRAFHAAIAGLDARQRLLLRQHTLDGLGIDQLAALHGVHRSTAARQVQFARDAVLARTRRELIRRLRLSAGELDSMMRLIQSQLDVSLQRVLSFPE
jgi:RNA polymerase sigma-70 factor (ECF subfamily)